MKMRVICLLTVFILFGCATSGRQKSSLNLVSKPQWVDEVLIGQRPYIPKIESVISLSPEQKQHFLARYNKVKDIPTRKLFNYMQSHLKSASYSTITLSASDVLSQNSGNCLSLAILTKSLADAADIGIRYQMVKVPPVFKKSNDIILSSQHIRSVLYDTQIEKGRIPGKMTRSVSIDYNPSEQTKTLRWVEEDEFFSLYYTNRAAELLAENKISDAYWYLKEALNFKGSSVQAINMMGVVHSRLGFESEAEQWYLYGMSFGKGQFELLKNYYTLLKRNHRLSEAQQVAQQLSRYDAENPFEWVALGDDAFDNNQFEEAIRYYKKAANMAKYLHEPYAGIAKAQFELGNTRKAHKALKTAMKNSDNEEVLSVYQQKYNLYSNELEK